MCCRAPRISHLIPAKDRPAKIAPQESALRLEYCVRPPGRGPRRFPMPRAFMRTETCL